MRVQNGVLGLYPGVVGEGKEALRNSRACEAFGAEYNGAKS